jgi:ubiquitin carboxyl-terminal hydrolase 10
MAPPSSDQSPKPAPPPPKALTKSWADLVRTNTTKVATGGISGTNSDVAKTNGFEVPRVNSLADVLSSFSVDEVSEGDAKVSFLEPRGLVNTGNMCYMNSVSSIP